MFEEYDCECEVFLDTGGAPPTPNTTDVIGVDNANDVISINDANDKVEVGA